MVLWSRILLCCLFALTLTALTADPAPAATARPAAETARHPLRAGDTIDVQVFGEEELHAKGQIDPSGEVGLTLLGKVKVEGKTPDEAAEFIRELYMKDYLVDPLVSVQVLDFAKNRVTILGQVKTPGVYQFPTSEKLNILQAIARAGGYTRIGEPSKIIVKRVVDGKETMLRVNAKAMASDVGEKLFEIQSEDTITVGETVF